MQTFLILAAIVGYAIGWVYTKNTIRDLLRDDEKFLAPVWAILWPIRSLLTLIEQIYGLLLLVLMTVTLTAKSLKDRSKKD